MAPNYYDKVPSTQLCLFANVYLVNMSNNVLTTLQQSLTTLNCLTFLNTLDFSSNQIKTALSASDFDDTLAAKLVFLNLNNNKIPSIETATFLKSDGSSRFPKLIYLGLSNNMIKAFDLLWPLSLPSPALQVDLKNNPIDALKNELNRQFTDSSFSYAISGNSRFVDVTNNNLQTLSDYNLLKYRIKTAADFKTFLNKVSNYDFRQSNLVPTIFCYCPPNGLFTNTWYTTFSSSLANANSPIYKLYCSNMVNMYIFGFSCSTNAPLTTTTSTTREFVTLPSNLLNNQTAATFDRNYLYLLLLLIPLAFILFIVCMCCCCGRCCQLATFKCCSCALCSCLRADNSSAAQFSGKSYDATVCYCDSDEMWVDEDFMPQLARCSRGYKFHKLNFNLRANNKQLNKENEHILRSSKRIIVLFTRRFVEQEWKNRHLRELLRRICIDDPYCILICVNFNVPEQRMRSILQSLQSNEPPHHQQSERRISYYESNNVKRSNPFDIDDGDDDELRSKKLSWYQRMRSRVNYSLHLSDVELLDYNYI